ncbi:hypothetical protein H7H73_01575 [Mycobacterium rufum]|uniref:Uncharacterized protein n=1 Tax=Mycolicibacterium rufum TaxID=318424 RepID=A0A9X2Y9Y0_9MYCO|nr:hypothetical protein [Mycolicibacterium rufum]
MASHSSSVTPVLRTNAATADTANATHPSRFTAPASQSRERRSSRPATALTATMPRTPLSRNAVDPVASGTHT